jgi:hypothetical protein
MRTRRSPRNQDALFKALFKPKEEPRSEQPPRSQCRDCRQYPAQKRDTYNCPVKGMKVGLWDTHECFVAKPPKPMRRRK